MDWVAGIVTGRILFTQECLASPVQVTVDVRGLVPGHMHGFHIHAKPATGAASLQQSCAACGGHFNPLDQPHGSVFVDGTARHVGDLVNNLLADDNGRAQVRFQDNLLSLIPTPQRPYTVVGKSIVIHEGTDDLGQQGSVIRAPCLVGETVRPGVRDERRKYAEAAQRKESTVTGNAGARRACGNIRRVL